MPKRKYEVSAHRARQQIIIGNHSGTTPMMSNDELEEKRRIHVRLVAFRAQHGLGCLPMIENASGRRSQLTASLIRDMLNGGRHGIDIWRRLDNTLDKIEAKEGSVT